MFDFVGVSALLLLTATSAWLAVRARRAGNRVVRWAGLVSSSLVALASTAALVYILIGFSKINFPPHPRGVTDRKVDGTPEQVARGARFGPFCAQCHSPDGRPPLSGKDFTTDGPPVGTFWAPNLTPAGEIGSWSDDEIIRAIREGVHKNNRALVVMPSEVFRNLSDVDVEGIVAYLRSQPAVAPNSPPARFNILAAFMLGAGIVSTSAQPPITQPIVAPPEGETVAHGQYLVSILGCRLCHGENLTGGKVGGPGPPAGPNIRGLLTTWSSDDFVRTLRTGIDPYHHTLTEQMPWQAISAFATDADLRAVLMYLHSLSQ